ncbi:E3 ubiquitin-protein ligase TRIM33 [Chelonia mydas]|uniref:E3 ubiquitin-protein ligase TRIM33 n=1 Tax=Chelonia mydas TaxID=8469 RepID=M7BJV3_CHEMY|nr:E3 ubiquitin-protein ligase TRIM33 [Chelonia mydas]
MTTRCVKVQRRQARFIVDKARECKTFLLCVAVGVIRCPICRQECRQIDLVDNYFVKDTSEAPSSSDEKSEQVCTSCEDNASAVGFCVECGEWLCKTCIEAHQRVKFTKDHMIRKKEDVSSVLRNYLIHGREGAVEEHKVFEGLWLCSDLNDAVWEFWYQFLEEAFQNQKGAIENLLAKLLEKKNYVNFAATQVQNRIKEVNETNKRVEQEIKVAIFTLINEINKKGKSLLQQLENVTKERQMKLIQQQNDITGLSRQVKHVMNFTNWAIASGSSTALLYSKRLITFQLRHILKARCDPVPAANGAIRFHCDPTFWAKNVVNLGNLVIENKPTPSYTPNVVVGQVPPGTNHINKAPGQINLAQLRLQHMQQQHSNPGHAGPFPVVSVHNTTINPTSPTTATMANANRGPTSPSVTAIELIPSVTNPENLPSLPDIPPIQLEDAGSSNLDNLLSRYISGSHLPPQPTSTMNPSPGPSALSPGSSDFHAVILFQLSSPESSLTPPLSTNLHLESELEALGSLENHVKTEPTDLSESCKQSGHSLVNGKSPVRSLMHRSARIGGEGNNKEDDPNEDWCAVCQNGGDLLCCEKCPKVFHLTCHVPTLLSFPSGEWICTFCRDLSKPEVEYDCDNLQHSKKGKTAQGLSPVDQRIPNYYKIIKKPMDLSTVKKKLQKKHSQHYQTPDDFVADVRLIFKNCERFNEMMKVVQVYAETQEINLKADSEVAQAGKAVALYFEDKLTDIYPDRTFQPLPEFEQEEDDGEITEDSDEDFIQPRRKRLKSDERPVHINDFFSRLCHLRTASHCTSALGADGPDALSSGTIVNFGTSLHDVATAVSDACTVVDLDAGTYNPGADVSTRPPDPSGSCEVLMQLPPVRLMLTLAMKPTALALSSVPPPTLPRESRDPSGAESRKLLPPAHASSSLSQDEALAGMSIAPAVLCIACLSPGGKSSTDGRAACCERAICALTGCLHLAVTFQMAALPGSVAFRLWMEDNSKEKPRVSYMLGNMLYEALGLYDKLPDCKLALHCIHKLDSRDALGLV